MKRKFDGRTILWEIVERVQNKASSLYAQFKQLSSLGLLPWNRQDCYDILFREFSEEGYNRLMEGSLEVSRILSTSNEAYYKNLKSQGMAQEPISVFSSDSVTLYLKWFLWDQAGIDPFDGNTFVSSEEITRYAAYNHGFWAMEKYPYIVARPTAIILPEAGLTDEDCIILLDIYEVQDGSIPSSLPKHCRDLMLLRLYVMLSSDLLHENGKSSAKGKIMFVTSEERLDNSIVFDVVLGDSNSDPHAWRQTSEYLEVLSDHYLTKVLQAVSGEFLQERKHSLYTPRCDDHISCEFCPKSCPNANKLPYPYQRMYYDSGIRVVHLKDCYWGSIVNIRPCIISTDSDGAKTYIPLVQNCVLEDADENVIDVEGLLRENGNVESFRLEQAHYIAGLGQIKSILPQDSCICRQYGVRWNNKSSRTTKFYTRDELEKVSFLPPFGTAIYPSEVDEEVITISFHGDQRQNKAGIENGVWGKVVDVKKDEHGVKVKVLLENLKAGAESPAPYKTPWLKAEKFLVIDEDKYANEDTHVFTPIQGEIYKFDVQIDETNDCSQILSDRIAEIKAIFELIEGDLTHRQENLRCQDKIVIKINRDLCNQKKEEHLHASCTDVLQKYRHSAEANVSSRQKHPAIVLILECHRGRQHRTLTGNRESKKVGCELRIRITYFKNDPGHIYAEKLCGHTNHNPRIVSVGESLPNRLQSVLNKLFEERDYPPKKAFMHLSMCGMKQYNLDEEEMGWLTLRACKTARRQFINKQRSDGIANDEASCRILASDNKDSVLYLVEEPGNWQFAIMTPEQRKVLQVCSKMIFIDACHSLNKKGDVTLTMLVRDPYGNGFPVAYCLCSGGETAAVWSKFLKTVVEKCELNPDNITFMLDKSTACIAALKSLRYNFILCIFHVMQAWGRHLRNASCPVKNKNHIFGILKYVRKLSRIPDVLAFDEEVQKFKNYLHAVDPTDYVLKYYDQEWSPIDHTWGKHGRTDLRHMFSDTNNLLESFFRSVKRDYLNGQRAKRRDILILALLNQANGFHIQSLKSKLRNPEISESHRSQKRYEESVITCRQKEKQIDGIYDMLTEVQVDKVLRLFSHDGTVHYTCMGDFSCTCDDNEDDICMHVESLLHRDDGQLLLCIDHILETANLIKIALQLGKPHIQSMRSESSESEGVELYECWPSCFYVPGQFPSQNTSRKRLPFYTNKSDNNCTCHCYRLLSICPHLIALQGWSESYLRDVLGETLDNASIRRNNKVNQEWVHMLRLKLELTPTDQINVPLPARDDESLVLTKRKHNLSLLGHQFKTVHREFDKMSEEEQVQFLEEAIPPLVARAKRMNNGQSSYPPPPNCVSRSRAFDPNERNFHTQLRFRGNARLESGNDSMHLGTQQLEYLAEFVENTDNNSMDIGTGAIPSPVEIASRAPAAAGPHVDAVLRTIRADLHDNEPNQ